MQINPVIEKELKIKMRGWKSPVLMSLYLGFLGLIVLVYFLGNASMANYGGASFNPLIALTVYNTLAILQFILLMFITPALTGGAISGERERQTLDLLLCTNYSPFSIVIGKIFVSIAHIILLIAASLPIMATVFLYGGIGFSDLLLLFSFYIATALMLASIGTFYSTFFKKTVVSTIMTYITVGIFTVGTIIIFAIWGIYHYTPQGKSPTSSDLMTFLFANPMYGFSSLLDGRSGGMGRGTNIINIFTSMSMSNGTSPTLFGIEIMPWMANMAFNLVISAVFIFLSCRRIIPVKKPLFRKAGKKNSGHQEHL